MGQASMAQDTPGGAGSPWGILLRVAAALLILLAVLWGVWGYKDRPLSERPIVFEKGRYVGPEDQPFDPKAIEQTRLRARAQGEL